MIPLAVIHGVAEVVSVELEARVLDLTLALVYRNRIVRHEVGGEPKPLRVERSGRSLSTNNPLAAEHSKNVLSKLGEKRGNVTVVVNSSPGGYVVRVADVIHLFCAARCNPVFHLVHVAQAKNALYDAREVWVVRIIFLIENVLEALI